LKVTPEVEVSAWISEIVVSGAVNVEYPHKVVVFSPREADLVLRNHFGGYDGASVGVVEERLNQMLRYKFVVVLLGPV
jgi:hypothetical protein